VCQDGSVLIKLF